MQTVSATDLARSTRKILDTVASRGETILIERNHVTIARIVPPAPSMTATQALADWLPMLTPQQGADWLRDSRHAFDDTVRDPWR